MSDNPAPGFQKFPDYRVDFRDLPGHLEIYCAGALVCDTTAAIEVLESNHQPALYVPSDDLSKRYLRTSETGTHCPFKGDANYWTIEVPGQRTKDVFWYYPQPYDEVTPLRALAGVYLDRVEKVLLDGSPWPGTPARQNG